MDRYSFTITGYFGLGGIDLEQVMNHLVLAAGKPLTIRVSSVGGDVETGVSIRNAVSEYARTNEVDVVIDMLGWTQSTASYLATIPGAYVKAHRDTVYMKHNPMSWADGDYREFESRLTTLKGLTDIFRAAYAERSGMSMEEVAAQLDAETYLFGQEIIDAGYADELVEADVGQAAASSNRDDIIKFSQDERKRLQAAASASRKNNKPLESRAMEGSSMPEETKSGTPAASVPNAVPANDGGEALKAAEHRARAFGAAMRALPAELHDTVQSAFDEGRDASHFEGMVAHANAVASASASADEKKKHLAAKAEGEKLGDGQPAGDHGTPKPAEIKAAGETGRTIEVG